MVRSLTQICTFKLLKPCKSFSGEFNLTNVLLKTSFNVTMHNHTQVLKHSKQSQNLDGLFFPTHHTAQILLLQISTSLQPSKTPPTEGLAVRTRLFKKWRSICKHKIQPGTKGREMLLFLTGTRILKLMKIMYKNKACNTTIYLSYQQSYTINYHQ